MLNDFPPNPLILIVDDSLRNTDLLANFLEEDGFSFLVATDGETAMTLAKDQLPHLILLDIMMPGMDGFETCQALKNCPQTADIPIIFMTALSETSDKVKGLSVGAVDYITKPFQWDEVSARIKLHLRLRFLTEQLATYNALLEDHVQARTAELTQTLQTLQETQKQLLQREEKLRYDAFHDALTGLPNRVWLVEQLENAIASTQSQPQHTYAVFFLDLDRFKVINDSFGHLVGDELLKNVATRLQAILPLNTAIARFGGDEFAILVQFNQSEILQEVNAIAKTILEQIRLPFTLKNNYQIFTGVSIGITLSQMNYQQPDDILRDADIALYQAKQTGKARYSIFTPQMQTQVLTRLALENDLRKAIEQQEFCLYYQPILALTTGEMVGFEALVRWNHPQRGLVPPNLFIPLAEEIGLIHTLGGWVLQSACQQLLSWHSSFPDYSALSINVNLSPLQLQQPDLIKQLQQILEHHYFPKACLKLELTESSLLETNAEVYETLNQLAEFGISLCIDDFGTGYSSLNRLHELPLKILKIDRSFVSALNTDARRSKIVQTILLLAQNLEMEVVAEGIETQEQLEQLQNFGCHFGQGYFFSPPVDSQRATRFLQNQSARFDLVVPSS